ncbi:hypothetical protein [Bacillus sp. NEB1478]|uniref:hypothetical protein n=1 Tax=Bacillus sp. NEB1478 TaxID=3073816 RepID=UPI002873C3C3|nr:hypothetical protein [Bacillus sp. NEB1478]WNB93092.1 hypothetical protein RGB74_05320 [Bacillus sp. NEB1478]
MAQLVKIQDYVSRYEKNLYHYQSLFMRLKENRWNDFLHKNDRNVNYANKKETVKQFRENLFEHQIKWATTTVKEISKVEHKYLKDSRLQFLTQEIPDNYFLLYEPVLQIKNAPIELDIILAGPANIWLIVWMSGEGIWQETDNKRFWKNADPENGETRLNPFIRLERMNTIIGEWAKPYQQQLSVKQRIIAPDAYIDISNDWRKACFIDKRNFKEWHLQITAEPAPVKNQQLKFISDILKHGVTNSLYRIDPLSNESEFSFEGN